MGVFGFGNVGGAVGEDALAGFPSDGLSFLYKCDERTGDKLYDASGQWQPLQLATGASLDCAGSTLSVPDSTGLVAAFAGRQGIVMAGVEMEFTGADTGYVIGAATATTGPIRIYLSTSDRVTLALTTLNTGDTPTASTWQFGSTTALNPRLVPGARYQFGWIANALTGEATFTFRVGSSGAWSTMPMVSVTAVADSEFSATAGAVRLLATGASPATAHAGEISFLFAAAIETDIGTVQRLLERPTKSYAREVIQTYGRFWDFRAGEGTDIREFITDTMEEIVVTAGSVAWVNSQTGTSQKALRQGRPYYGKAGVRIGGEVGLTAVGGGAVGAANPGPSLGSATGWTFQCTASIGGRIPASAIQIIAGMEEPLIADGSYNTAPATSKVYGITYNTSGAVGSRMIQRSNQALLTGAALVGNNPTEKGVLSTYTIICPATTQTTLGFSVYRQEHGDTAPTKIGDYSETIDFRQTNATKVWIGNAAFDADATVGFVAVHNRVLTTAEMAQCHRSAVARMTGEPIYVAVGNGVDGNGTENHPYSGLHDALRRCQPNQVIHIGAGTYGPLSQFTSANDPSSDENISLYTSGAVVFTAPGSYTDEDDYPLYLDSGSWRFIATSPGYFHCLANGTSTPSGAKVLDGVSSFIADGIRFSGGYQSGSSQGSGLNIQADYFELKNWQAYDNDEHGIYGRIQASDTAHKRCVIQDGYAYSNAEDGIKLSDEGNADYKWDDCVIDRVRVDGGANQIYLVGVQNSTVTNFILENQSETGTLAALYLGRDDAAAGEGVCYNNKIANGTIYNAVLAVYDGKSAGTTVQNVVAVECTSDLRLGDLGVATFDHCAGNSGHETEVFPTGTSNIPDSADLALVDPANVTPASRDFHLDEGVDGDGDGVNLTTAVPQAATDYAGDARPPTGAWNMGAY